MYRSVLSHPCNTQLQQCSPCGSVLTVLDGRNSVVRLRLKGAARKPIAFGGVSMAEIDNRQTGG